MIFLKFVSCSKCHSIYLIEECKEKLPDKTVISCKCPYVHFPNHPHRAKIKACGTPLMKVVKTSSSTTTLYPNRMYCFKSIIKSLQEMIKRPGFIKKC